MPRERQKFLQLSGIGLAALLAEVRPGQPVQLSMSLELSNLDGERHTGQEIIFGVAY